MELLVRNNISTEQAEKKNSQEISFFKEKVKEILLASQINNNFMLH